MRKEIANRVLLILFFSIFVGVGVISCDKEEVKPPRIEEDDDDDDNTTPTGKEFIIYDALSYRNKPNLAEHKISRMEIIYEAQLTKKDPNTGKIMIDLDQITTFAEAAAVKGAKTIATDIEDWYGDSSISGDQMNTWFKAMFDVFREKNPNVRIANYGLPVANLQLRRFNRAADFPEEEVMSEWRHVNERRWAASESGDYYNPSLYIGESRKGSGKADVKEWIQDMKTMVDEIKAKGKSNYPIYVWIWPQYYNFDSSLAKKFIEPEIWKQMLEGAFEHSDGVILWSGTTDENENEVQWSDPRVQAMFEATKEFIAEHESNIILEVPGTGGEDTDPTTKTSFNMYHSIDFEGTPELASLYNLKKLKVVSEADLSGVEDANGILIPDLAKIEQLALDALEDPDTPVMINKIGSWIKDRTSDTEVMDARFKLISETFKAKNNKTKLLFEGVGPTGIAGLRLTEGRTEEQVLDSWFRYAANPMRGLRQYADILVPSVPTIDDNLETWKRDFNTIINEANVNRDPNKPLYAFVWTNYHNRKDSYPFFDQAYKPIKEETFLEMLETIYTRCDGVIIGSNAQKDDPVTWSEDLGIAKALTRFYQNHKNVIGDLPGGGGDPDPDPNPDPDPVDPTNIIVNGGFEEPLSYYSLLPNIHGTDRERLPRGTTLFATTSATTFPTFNPAVPITDYAWFHRTSNNNQWFLFTYIEDRNPASTMSNEVPHSGEKSLALYIAGGAARTTTHDFVFALAQRVELDDSKKYNLKFFVQKDAQSWGPPVAANLNYAEKLNIGITSSNDASQDYTYYVSYDLPTDGEWTEVNVPFDLPAIRAANPGKSFAKSAIFISLVPTQFTLNSSSIEVTRKHQVNIDDVSLVEIE
jgi:hypothetical protein